MPTPRQRTTLYILATGVIALLVWLQYDQPKRPVTATRNLEVVAPERRAPPARARAKTPDTKATIAKKLPPRVETVPRVEETPTPERRTKVVVHVLETDGTPVGRAPVTSSDCDIYTIARGGRAVVFIEPDQVCTLRGGRRDGILVAWSDPVMVEGGIPEDEVYLEVPAEKTAGLGISIAEHEDGVLVRHVFNGSPAAEAGMRAGDIIVELERQNTAKMLLDDFITEATGPVGTTVEVVVARGVDTEAWEEVSMTVERREVSRQRG